MFMSQRRGTATDQLTNVIQVIQLGKKTGLLRVERGDERQLETGEITFAQGHITQATSGRLIGQEALNWLSTWGACRFLFIPSSVEDRITKPIPTPRSQAPATPPTSTQPLAKDTGSFRIEQLSPALPTTNPYGFDTVTSELTSSPRRIRPLEEALRLIEHARLSRLHRHLFLLIDGRRTTTELIRIMGRNTEEVLSLLHDLERIGIIQG